MYVRTYVPAPVCMSLLCDHAHGLPIQYASKKPYLKSRVATDQVASQQYTLHTCKLRTVEDHGCTGQGRHATQTTIQCYSRPMLLLLLYRTPNFGCSSFFVYRELCKNRPIDVRGRTQCYTYML